MPSQATQQMLNAERAKLATLKAQAAATPIAPPRPQQFAANPPAAPVPSPAPSPTVVDLLTPPPLAPAPPAPVVAAPPAPVGLPPAPQNELDPANLLQRLRTIEGVQVANATSRQALERQLAASQDSERRLREDHTRLTQQIAELTRPPPPVMKVEDYYSPEEIETEGYEVLEKRLKVVQQSNAAQINALVEARVKPLEQQLQQTRQSQQQTAHQAQVRREQEFIDALSLGVPGWETWALRDDEKGIKVDYRFAAWLETKVYGKTRGQLLQEAQSALDSATVVDMLQEFLRSVGQHASPQPQPHSRQIPEGRPAGEDPAPPAPQYDFTESQVLKFQQDVTHGKYMGRGREVHQIHERIRAAAAAGRIGPG
jgi:hypothetical protein